MKSFKIERATIKNIGTFGILYDSQGNEVCRTVERDWEDNKSNISCIPDGIYTAEPCFSNRFGQTYILHNVDLGVGKYEGESDRFGILIHAANWPYQLKGCIAPVMAHTMINDVLGGSSSRDALNLVLALFDGENVEIELTTQRGRK